jgi:hypothetical protein
MKQADPIHKTMDRDDLLTPEGSRFVRALSDLVVELERRRLPVTSWYGGLPENPFELSRAGARALARRILGRSSGVGETAWINRGGETYDAVPGIAFYEAAPVKAVAQGRTGLVRM